jgi:uncharacterized protein (DUF2062 family)/SAM-dependent methyltransferase
LIRKIKLQARHFMTLMRKEGLDPRRSAAAVFLGIFIGIIPIYGFQTVTALGVAALFRLNKPLTVAATFINNPLFLPVILFSSVELGCLLWTGSFPRLDMASLVAMRHHLNKEQFLIWIVGSVALGVLVGAIGAIIAAAVARRHRKLRTPANTALTERVGFVEAMYSKCPIKVRQFVRWKLRLDKMFELLAAENLGAGTIVDLGCGYGNALGFLAYEATRRRLIGCDIDAGRIAFARKALAPLNAELTAVDVRQFEFPTAELILIMDVLHYLTPAQQQELLQRCCTALEPNGLLIFRVPNRRAGFRGAFSMALERLIFMSEGNGLRRPEMLPANHYRTALQNANLQLEERSFENRLPLSHVLFVARKPLEADDKNLIAPRHADVRPALTIPPNR